MLFFIFIIMLINITKDENYKTFFNLKFASQDNEWKYHVSPNSIFFAVKLLGTDQQILFHTIVFRFFNGGVNFSRYYRR